MIHLFPFQFLRKIITSFSASPHSLNNPFRSQFQLCILFFIIPSCLYASQNKSFTTIRHNQVYASYTFLDIFTSTNVYVFLDFASNVSTALTFSPLCPFDNKVFTINFLHFISQFESSELSLSSLQFHQGRPDPLLILST